MGEAFTALVRTGSFRRRPIWAPAITACTYSGVPKAGEPVRMSTLEVKPPMTHGRAGAHQLAQHHDAERLGGLLHQRSGQRHRRHGAHEREGRDDDALPVPRHDDDVVEDLLVHAPRRVDVGHRHERRARRQLLDRAAVLDGRHGDGILGLHAADAACRPDDVRALDVRLVGVEVAHRHLRRRPARPRCRPASAAPREPASA